MTDEDIKQPVDQDDDEIIADCRAYIDLCDEFDKDNRTEALDDLWFLSGKTQWDERDRAQRQAEGRPCLTTNKLPTFLHQVTNQQRQNKPSIKIHAVDDNADPETAEVLQGMIRHIEYSSNADAARDTAVNSAAAIGFGFFRLLTDYVDETSFDQEIRFDRIRNAMTVRFDPRSKEADGSDQMRCALDCKVSKEDFRRDYPKAELSVDPVGAKGLGDWLAEDEVRVVEFYRVELKPTKLCLLSNGETIAAGDYTDEQLTAAGVTKVKERDSFKRTVMWYKLTALEILERAEIPCRWIPVFPVWGDELDVNGKVIRSGLVRHAKDPAKMYNYWMTSATEEVALRVKTPYIGAEGQFEGHEKDWKQANRRSFPYLEYNPITIDGNLAPAPQRQAMADVPSGMLAMAMHANDNIKATTGLFDSSLGARGTATSGIQERAQQMQGDVANFHYTDNLMRAIRHCGRCIVDMIPTIYDTMRVVRILGEDDSADHAVINKPLPVPQQDENGTIKRVLNDLSVGKYDVTVTSGPSYTTLRQEASEAMIEFGKNWPRLMEVAGDKVVRSMDWPGAEEIAERIERTIPQEIRQDADEQGPQIPPEVQQQMGQMQQIIQQLQQQLQMAQSGLQKAEIDSRSREEVARINAEKSKDVEEIKGYIAMLMAKMQPPQILAADVAQDIQQEQ